MGSAQAPAPIKLSKARRRALDVLADRYAKGRTGRVSNVTDLDEGYLYWQSAEWLVAQGLAEMVSLENGYPSNTYIRITPAGLQLVEGSR